MHYIYIYIDVLYVYCMCVYIYETFFAKQYIQNKKHLFLR